MKYSFVIWDFNGTILDDVQIGIDSINVLLKRRALPLINGKDEYKEWFMFPIIEGYKKLGFDFEKESYGDVAEEWMQEYLCRESRAVIVDGIKSVLEYFKKKGIKQVIISASEIGMLKRQLENLGISEYFEDVVGLDNIHAASKKEIAISWRKKHQNDSLLFLGDTDHDHQVALAMDADCVLVSWGHQSFERLEKIEPRLALIKHTGEIFDILNGGD